MMEELITVVIPVYNSAEYVGKCLDSILEQTYSNLKIICVNDGSTDNSQDVIKGYELKDSRVHCYIKENGGAASARNYGIDLFMNDDESEYLSFVDSDDEVEKDYIEVLYRIIKDYDADVATCDMKDIKDDTPSSKEIEILTRKETLEYYFKDLVFRESPVCKLFKKETFRELRFPDGKHFEDTFVTYKIIEMFDKIGHIKYYAYLVNMTPNSLTRSTYNNDNYDKVEAGLEIWNYYKGSEFERTAYNKYLGIIFYFIMKTNANKDKVDKNETAIKEVKEVVQRNGYKDAGLRFYPFILATKMNLIGSIKI